MIQVEWDKLTSFHFDYKELFSIAFDSANGFPEQRARAFMHDHWYFVVQCSIAYFFLIFGIKFIMRNREPFDLQRPLNAWNLFLAIFSTAGAIFMAPDFFGILWKGGLRGSYCDLNGMMSGTNGFWMWLFMLSKLAEFTDTFFIVLRKKPLMFLHWYHHILTLIYGFYSYPVSPAYNRWGIYLNFAVHSFMYSYYFLRSIRVPIPGAVAKAITTGQILQFVLSIVVLVFCGVEYYILKSMGDCTFDVPSFWLAVLMDTTYLILFVNFFLKSYVIKGGKDKYKKLDGKEGKKKQ
ncbi:elo-1 [Pristionchus pacificus]|uniref:Elongation of very long chain fatty acids protein n=1 Tax=Pristionchus pacificus TaxID=54126 RepID=A0A454Y240_PRIPA|nr:elo-1 [Pristionchus pacificus]|eukprot:PDM64165.1 elo-1 [Pristionchus pacificus]